MTQLQHQTHRRAIVFLAWGETFIEQIDECLRNSTLPDYPIFIITDETTNVGVEHRKVEVIRTSFTHYGLKGHTRKCELLRHLPDGYNSFLFLDTDTRILGDLSLGFDKAEQHGIAMAQAAHYSLDAFRDFRRIMTIKGVSPRGQLLYNSGVIFFSLTPDTKQVLQLWDELGAEFANEPIGDQAFLTLAMELLEFNPYTLSTSYNHRAFGELISGEIRIWHSQRPVPDNIGELEPIFPRSYSPPDGRIIPHNKLFTDRNTCQHPPEPKCIFLVHGLKRSGIHAIIDWLDAQGSFTFINNSIPILPMLQGDSNVPRIKPFSKWWRSQQELVEFKSDYLIVGVEDHPLSTLPFKDAPCLVRNILVLREPINLFSSRIQKSYRDGPNMVYPQDLGSDMNRGIALWKEHAKEYLGLTNTLKKRTSIYFDRWFSSQEYRNKISKKLALNFTDKGLLNVSTYGGGSSFSKTSFDGRAQDMNVLNRRDSLDARGQTLLDHISHDDELRVLAEKIRGR